MTFACGANFCRPDRGAGTAWSLRRRAGDQRGTALALTKLDDNCLESGSAKAPPVVAPKLET